MVHHINGVLFHEWQYPLINAERHTLKDVYTLGVFKRFAEYFGYCGFRFRASISNEGGPQPVVIFNIEAGPIGRPFRVWQ
jgi:hypothetical protein